MPTRHGHDIDPAERDACPTHAVAHQRRAEHVVSRLEDGDPSGIGLEVEAARGLDVAVDEPADPEPVRQRQAQAGPGGGLELLQFPGKDFAPARHEVLQI